MEMRPNPEKLWHWAGIKLGLKVQQRIKLTILTCDDKRCKV